MMLHVFLFLMYRIDFLLALQLLHHFGKINFIFLHFFVLRCTQIFCCFTVDLMASMLLIGVALKIQTMPVKMPSWIVMWMGIPVNQKMVEAKRIPSNWIMHSEYIHCSFFLLSI